MNISAMNAKLFDNNNITIASCDEVKYYSIEVEGRAQERFVKSQLWSAKETCVKKTKSHGNTVMARSFSQD